MLLVIFTYFWHDKEDVKPLTILFSKVYAKYIVSLTPKTPVEVPPDGACKTAANSGNVQFLLDLYDIDATISSSVKTTIFNCGKTLPTMFGDKPELIIVGSSIKLIYWMSVFNIFCVAPDPTNDIPIVVPLAVEPLILWYIKSGTVIFKYLLELTSV